jgi:hypothetical protein
MAVQTLSMVRSPKRTEVVRTDDCRSPSTSGMSLKKAMTTLKRHMKALAKSSWGGSTASLWCGRVREAARRHTPSDAPLQHGCHVQEEAKLHRQRADDQDACRGENRGALPAQQRVVSGVSNAQRHAGGEQ